MSSTPKYTLEVIKPYKSGGAVRHTHLYMESEQSSDLCWWEERLTRQGVDFAVGKYQAGAGRSVKRYKWGIFVEHYKVSGSV